ncbi:hypothetical protein LCGC14_1075090 [marine sediment metagenome]|uniref:Uncharacterized protein n=1 Tax=marine sediment metagenome TaxID=412755 RepID=A0A0F9Q006_9ZZZZ
MSINSKSNLYVIILAAGFGRRLRPISNRIPKPLIDINGEPIILRIILSFKQAGFDKFLIIVGYKKELVMKEVSKIKEVKIKFVEQKKPSGMADAAELAFIHLIKCKNGPVNFFITAADIIFSKEEILKMYKLFLSTNSKIVLSLMKSHDHEIARGHGNVKILHHSELNMDLDPNQGLQIVNIIEKPRNNQILSEYYSLPLYLVDSKVTRYFHSVKISERAEKELQDVIKFSIDNGDNVRGIRIIETLINSENVGKYHLTNLKDVLKMNFRFLSGKTPGPLKSKTIKIIEPVKIDKDSRIDNKVTLGPNVIIHKSCKIADYCELTNVILNKSVSLGKRCKLNWCIIDENANLPENFQAENSYITRDKNLDLEVIRF